jgi:hypothetical protein
LLYGELPIVWQAEKLLQFSLLERILPLESCVSKFHFFSSEKTYQGMKNAVMFETVVGHSFKCVSEQSLQLSSQLQLKTMNVQLQAFDFEGDGFGNGKFQVPKRLQRPG